MMHFREYSTGFPLFRLKVTELSLLACSQDVANGGRNCGLMFRASPMIRPVGGLRFAHLGVGDYYVIRYSRATRGIAYFYEGSYDIM